MENLSETEAHICVVLRNIWTWNVPIFMMISGVVFLDPEKNISIKILLTKYVSRLLLALFVFGVPFAFMEIYFNANYRFSFEQVGTSFLYVLQGKTWDHLWYLYSIIGIYLVIPLLKPFVNNVGKKGVEYILAILFMFTSVIPTAENFFNFTSGFYIPINSIFVFYFLLGHYVHHYKTSVGNKILAGLTVFFLVFNVLVPLPGLIEGNSPIVVMITFVLFCFARQNYRQNKWIDLISPLCFGMYLIHMLFINFFWIILKFTPEKYPPLLVAPVTVIAVIGLSALFSHSAHRIKFVRQHLL